MNWRTRSNKPGFLARLVDGDDPTFDSLIVSALAALLILAGAQLWDVIKLHHEFSPTGFGAGAGGIIGSLGGGKALRGIGAKKADQPTEGQNA